MLNALRGQVNSIKQKGQVNSIKQKSEGLIEEYIEINEKKKGCVFLKILKKKPT